MRFLSMLIAYANPRQSRRYIRIHSNKLVDWSSRDNYKKYLNELEKKEIIKRNNYFLPGEYSKAITFKGWTFRESKKGIYVDERTPEKYETIIQESFKDPRDYSALLRSTGRSRQASYVQTKDIFDMCLSL